MRSILKVATVLITGTFFLIICPLINANERSGTLMVIVNFTNENYSIKKAWVLKQNFPALSAYGSLSNDLVFQLTDFNNNEIMKVRIRNPRIIRIPLMQPGSDEHAGISNSEHEKYLEEGSFILRFPYYTNVRYVNLLGSGTVEVGSGRSSASPKENEKVILQMDLFNHLNN